MMAVRQLVVLLLLASSVAPGRSAPTSCSDTRTWSFVQRSVRATRAAQEDSLWPVLYVHIPKTGGNFATTVAHAACDDFSPMAESFKTIDGTNLPTECHTSGRLLRLRPGHSPLGGEDFARTPEPKMAHVMTLFRDPRQRLMSGYFHGRHDCHGLLKQVAPLCSSQDSDMMSEACFATQQVTPEGVEAYARCAGSCQSRMLVGLMCGGNEPLQEAEQRLALERVAALGFVGLTDEYDLSVCLFHARFGGQCHSAEFSNLRPGVHRHEHKGYAAPLTEAAAAAMAFEEKLYEAAKARFWADIRAHKVTRAVCQKLCPDPPEVFSVDTQAVNSSSSPSQQALLEFDYDWPGRLSFDADAFDLP